MASHFVFYDGASTDESDWGTWATAAGIDRTSSTNCYDSLADADSNVSAGETVYVASDHYKNYGASTTVTFPSCSIIVVDRSTGVPTPHTSSYGDGNFTSIVHYYFVLAQSACVYVYGLRTSGTYYLHLQGTNSLLYARKCTLSGTANTLGYTLYFDPANTGIMSAVFDSCTFDLKSQATTSLIAGAMNTKVSIIAPTFQNVPSTAIIVKDQTTYGGSHTVSIRNADLSGFGTGLSNKTTSAAITDVTLEDCLLPTSWTEIANAMPTATLRLIRSASSSAALSTADTKDMKVLNNGHTSEFDTAVYRNASDSENSYSIKVVSSSSATMVNSAKIHQRLAVWHDGSGSKTLTVHMWGPSGLYDDDVYAIVTYPDTAATAYQLGEVVSTFPAGARAAAGTSTYLDNDSEGGEWSGSGGTTTYQIKVASIAPTNPGYVYVDLFVTKPSTTIWVDHAITLT